MFIEAIEEAAKYTRSIHFIQRYLDSTTVFPGTATMFFVNDEGWALTCRHVVQVLNQADAVNTKYQEYKAELAAIQGKKGAREKRKKLWRKYNYDRNHDPYVPVAFSSRFYNCILGPLKVKATIHKKHDVALLRFSGFEALICDTFPVFPADTTSLKQGKSICRLGFPFPEFANFDYDEESDSIVWTDTGRTNTPRFPLEGMVTRHLGVYPDYWGFELSTPGLKGQSGGPAFDTTGKVWGMQFATAHLDLNFDIDEKVIRNGQKKPVQDSAFLHVGGCVHADVLKSFMREQGVAFQEE